MMAFGLLRVLMGVPTPQAARFAKKDDGIHRGSGRRDIVRRTSLVFFYMKNFI